LEGLTRKEAVGHLSVDKTAATLCELAAAELYVLAIYTMTQH